MGGGDEPEDLERYLRETIKDEDLAKLLLYGVPAYLGFNLSGKLGDDKIFSIMPYGEWKFNGTNEIAQTAASLAGPAFSQIGKFGSGIGYIANGDYYKGVEKFMPKGVENALKSFRLGNEGYTLKNGDVMFRPEDISGAALALEAVGIPSSQMTEMNWVRGQQYEIKKFYKDRTTEIEHAYYRAYKDGDSDVMSDLREEWRDLQSGKDNLRQYFNDRPDELKRQPISNLLKYPATAKKREAKLQRGAED